MADWLNRACSLTYVCVLSSVLLFVGVGNTAQLRVQLDTRGRVTRTPIKRRFWTRTIVSTALTPVLLPAADQGEPMHSPM